MASFVRQKSRAQTAAHLHAAHYYQEQFYTSHSRQRDEAYRLTQETGVFTRLHRRGYNNALLALYQELLAGNDWQPETAIAARVSLELGNIRNAVGQKSAALEAYGRALVRFCQAGLPEGMVEALNNLGAMHQALQAYRPAREAYQEALLICMQVSRKLAQQGATFNNLGRLAYLQGRQVRRCGDPARARVYLREALSCYEQALAWYRAAGMVGEEMVALNNLGLLYHELAGQQKVLAYCEEERRCYIQALRLFRETSDRWQEWIALRNLGRFYPLDQTLSPDERYQVGLVCLALADKIATEPGQPQDVPIPIWLKERSASGW